MEYPKINKNILTNNLNSKNSFYIENESLDTMFNDIEIFFHDFLSKLEQYPSIKEDDFKNINFTYELTNIFRKDIANQTEAKDLKNMLNNFPQKKGNFIVVPRIL